MESRDLIRQVHKISKEQRGCERLGAGKDGEECLILSGGYTVSDQEDAQLYKWS